MQRERNLISLRFLTSWQSIWIALLFWRKLLNRRSFVFITLEIMTKMRSQLRSSWYFEWHLVEWLFVLKRQTFRCIPKSQIQSLHSHSKHRLISVYRLITPLTKHVRLFNACVKSNQIYYLLTWITSYRGKDKTVGLDVINITAVAVRADATTFVFQP
jgi:hypothetical protein